MAGKSIALFSITLLGAFIGGTLLGGSYFEGTESPQDNAETLEPIFNNTLAIISKSEKEIEFEDSEVILESKT